MHNTNQAQEAEYTEYLSYLYRVAAYKYPDCEEIDTVIQETILAFLAKHQKGEPIDHPKGFLCTILQNRYNSYLRRKHKDRVLIHEYLDGLEAEDTIQQAEEHWERDEEYESIRREISRLIRIHREVTVRHYMHGHSVERIAKELGIPRGTVLSRLSGARKQIKEGLNTMKKYTSASYEPKQVLLGTRGYQGMSGEPRSLIHSSIEQNILILAYEKPLPVRQIADAMGIPCAYLEPMIDRLIQGELMGKTTSGLVYTRCLLIDGNKQYGDIPAQEELAKQMAELVWGMAQEHFREAMERPRFINFSEKQKVTLLLAILYQALLITVERCEARPSIYDCLPERPNGGRWFATGFVYDADDRGNPTYTFSGPTQHRRTIGTDGSVCQMLDCQSVFGDTAFAYRRFKYQLSSDRITAFYASLLPGGIVIDDSRIYEMVPDFEAMHTVKRRRCGALQLTIPALPFEELEKYWYPARTALADALAEVLGTELAQIMLRNKRQIPRHVDGREYHKYAYSLQAYPVAQLLAIVEKGLLPYSVTVGKTPLIYLAYQPTDQ
ncbi:MAG: sigma-70 family RNA polymerase sigma factor [Clostridia bacterium]|nr:sigma-70 family RNA polymerase sigma factor [Clostridia bacterium]